MTNESYIQFVQQASTGKTEIHHVMTKGDEPFRLGTIKWHGAWRRYCFFTEPDTIFDCNCLQEIMDFINNLMAVREKQRTAEENNKLV